MKFSTRRGRPRKEKQGKDLGTIELQNKRKTGLTSEPLDLCLARGLITEVQHSAGLRLRWLYTLRLGAPNISAYSPEKGGKLCKYEDSGWLARKQLEYKKMLAALDKTGARRIVANVCIMGHMPLFLISTHSYINELKLLQEGLDSISNPKYRDQKYHQIICERPQHN